MSVKEVVIGVGPTNGETEAVTKNGPAVALALNEGDVACPKASVKTVFVVPPPVKIRLAPEDGAVNVTGTPATGVPFASFTSATNGLG